MDNLLDLFSYEFEADFIYRSYFRCGKCSGKMRIRVQPHWVQKVERIKLGLDLDIRRENDWETDDTSSMSDDMYDAQSTWSEESGVDGVHYQSGVVDEGCDILSDSTKAYEKRDTDEESGAIEEEEDDDASITSEPSILDCVYDRSLIVCIWCWEYHKENGYKWISEDGDKLHISDCSDNDYSPYLFPT